MNKIKELYAISYHKWAIIVMFIRENHREFALMELAMIKMRYNLTD